MARPEVLDRVHFINELSVFLGFLLVWLASPRRENERVCVEASRTAAPPARGSAAGLLGFCAEVGGDGQRDRGRSPPGAVLTRARGTLCAELCTCTEERSDRLQTRDACATGAQGMV